MEGPRVCRVCRATLTSEDEARSPGSCPYCRSSLDSDPDADQANPYAPPQAELGGKRPDPHWYPASAIPATLGRKLIFSFKLFFGNFFLIAALVLTVWLPGNLASNLIIPEPVPPPERVMNVLLLRFLIETALGPIYAGGILYVLANRMTGQPSGYLEALQVGFHNWWRLFAARCITGLIVFLGILAFIVPGIVFAIRYSLIDPVVVLEGAEIDESRARSTKLVRGKEVEILCGSFLLFVVLFAVATLLQAAAQLHPALENYWVGTAADCVNDLARVISTCFLFTYFWESHLQRPVDLLMD